MRTLFFAVAVCALLACGRGGGRRTGAARPPAPNFPPSVVITNPSGILGGAVPVSYSVTDPEYDPVSVFIEVRIEGTADWREATASSGSEGTHGLSSSPWGVSHSFTWNSVADGIGLDGSPMAVRLRLTPHDGNYPGPTVETSSFSVANRPMMAWGRNGSGQLGDGTLTDRSAPVAVPGTLGMQDCSAGYEHTLALMGDGSVLAWGANESGQLGDGTFTNRSSPAPVGDLSTVVGIAAGYHHGVALEAEGVVMWGRHHYRDDVDVPENRSTPGIVLLRSDIRSVAAGDEFTVVILDDGRVMTWGDNEYGQLGDGTVESRATPRIVAGVENVREVVCGRHFVLALLVDGTLRSWGENGSGQLWNGTTTYAQTTPVVVTAVTGVVAVAGGGYHSLAVKNDGTVWACGYNYFGQIGNGATGYAVIPVQVSGISSARSVAAGGVHSLAVLSDGTMRGWGANGNGQLGNSTVEWRSLVPALVEGIEGAMSARAGYYHSLAP